uniref:Uncharacterized protein n=1 Tax=Strongyloides papillosus TaxID=174720 RepID=A0A0N5B6W0_STREA
MNVFILVPYTFALFSVSQGGMGNVWGRVWDGTKKFFFGLWNRHPASRSLYEFLDRDVDPCDNFYKFSCEVLEGKYNDQSRAINTFYNLYKRCEKELPEDKIEDCKSKISDFGIYAMSSLYLKEDKTKEKNNKEFESITLSIFDKIKEEFKLLIDEKKRFN